MSVTLHREMSAARRVASVVLLSAATAGVLVPLAQNAAIGSSERLGARLAQLIASEARPAPVATTVAAVTAPPPAAAEEAQAVEEAPVPRGRSGAARTVTKAGPKQAPAPPHLFVRAATVRSWAGRVAIPNATFVPADDGRPAGLSLSGVSGLGVGVRDGDVLTHAVGQPVASRADVVGAVLAAHARGARAVTGTLYRGTDRYQLTVELPR